MRYRYTLPWHAVDNAAALERLLRAELPAGHILQGIAVSALAQRDNTDDVLFALEDGSGRVAVVHLMSSLNIDASGPSTEVYASIDSWAEQTHGAIQVDAVTDNMIFVMHLAGFDELEPFARHVINVLALTDFEERESTFYTDGHYFRGNIGNSFLKIYDVDALGIEGFRFAISIGSPGKATAHQVATTLAAAGFECLIPTKGWIYEDWNRAGAKYGFQE